MRVPGDFYPTPTPYTLALTSRLPITGVVVDPCDGGGNISTILRTLPGVKRVATNELFPLPNHTYDTHFDAAQAAFWHYLEGDGGVDWVVMNPPFSCALPMVKYARATARVGVAALLRLSFLEPTNPRLRQGEMVQGRSDFLTAHPPTRLIVLPRVSFTGKGNDSVTCAWMVWERGRESGAIQVVPR